MQRITREQARKYAFDWRDEPLLRVQPGEAFEIETYDASTGYFKTPEDKAIPGKRPGLRPHARRWPTRSAARSTSKGPSAATCSSSRSTTFVVDDYSWVAIGPRRGPLGESTRWPELSGDYTTKIFRTPPARAAPPATAPCTSATSISWPITPFVGTLGVAPTAR